LLRAWGGGLKPDPLFTVSEWADRYRKLSSRSAAEPGRYRTRRTPYMKEIMDALSPGHASLSWHGLCRVGGAAARALRQPDAAAPILDGESAESRSVIPIPTSGGFVCRSEAGGEKERSFMIGFAERAACLSITRRCPQDGCLNPPA
jgi:hypothetical protein